MIRRKFLSISLAAPFLARPSFAGYIPASKEVKGNLLPVPNNIPIKPTHLKLSSPWGQVLRTFGNPVLEGHFASRVEVRAHNLCMAMWDRGDRVLGVAQTEGNDSYALWAVVEAVLGRKPDIQIGPGSYLFKTDHYETAHWRLDADTAQRVNRESEAEKTHASSWKRPSKNIAKSLRPLTRVLGPPPENITHILWTEPSPEVPGGPVSENNIILGSGEYPEIEKAILVSAYTGRMLTPVPTIPAQSYIKSLGPLVPFTATLTNVTLPNGEYWGRFRILTV